MDNVIDNTIEYQISAHAMQRYAERIMGKENKTDIYCFIKENEEKIRTDINKLIRYGELIYTGKSFHKDNKGNIVDVFLKDLWVIIADNGNKNVITLYKIDLGIDYEFNKTYVSKMMQRLNNDKKNLENVQQQVEEEGNTYKGLISDAETQIKEYRSMIKNLEELCEGYRTIIGNNVVKVAQANKDIVDTLNMLIGKKEF